MKKLAAALAGLLLVAAPAQARTKPLTHKQARRALEAAAFDVGQHGETVLDGGCLFYRRYSAECALELRRGEGSCTLRVDVLKRKAGLFYRLDYADDRRPHMSEACVRR